MNYQQKCTFIKVALQEKILAAWPFFWTTVVYT